MSLIWKIDLFSKVSATEAKCAACGKIVKMPNRGTKGLFVHARTHAEYAAKLKKVEDKQASEKNVMDKMRYVSLIQWNATK
uniref:BED-type domain-containing protein n=1 Tax=Ditylenchus dipsaci TaxID=166011 RepID=A0A915E117_9BILA